VARAPPFKRQRETSGHRDCRAQGYCLADLRAVGSWQST
jgi:hypothetical protein